MDNHSSTQALIEVFKYNAQDEKYFLSRREITTDAIIDDLITWSRDHEKVECFILYKLKYRDGRTAEVYTVHVDLVKYLESFKYKPLDPDAMKNRAKFKNGQTVFFFSAGQIMRGIIDDIQAVPVDDKRGIEYKISGPEQNYMVPEKNVAYSRKQVADAIADRFQKSVAASAQS